MGIKTNKVIVDTLESIDGTFTINTKDIGSGSGSGIDTIALNGTNLDINLTDGTTKSVDLAPIDTKDALTIKGRPINDAGISRTETKYMAYVGNSSEIQFIDLPSEKTLIVTLESFGAVGDGVTDDTQAIQNAFNSVSGNVILHGQGKRYRVSSHLNINNDIRFQNAIIDASQDTLGTSNTGILEVTKTTLFGTEYTLNTDFKKSTRMIDTVQTPSDINVGDFIFVYDPNVSFDTYNEAKIGQIFKVKSVDTTNKKIEVVGKSLYTFGGSNAKVKKINTIEAHFEEIEIISNNIDMCTGIRFYGAVNSSVKNCYFHNLEFSAIETNFTMNCTFEGNLFEDILNSETGYGINLDDSTNNIICRNNKGYNVRHLITCGGAYTCNHLIYDGNFGETFDAGLDTHNGSNYVTIVNNHITIMDYYDTADQAWGVYGDGIIVQGANNVIANNSIFNGRYGVYVQSFAKDKDQKNIVSNNIIEDCEIGVGASSVYGEIIIDNNSITNSWNGYNKFDAEDIGYIGVELGNNDTSLQIDSVDSSVTCSNNKIKNIYYPIGFYSKRTNQFYNSVEIISNSAKNSLANKRGDETFIYIEGLDANTTSSIKNITISNNQSDGYFVGIDYADIKADDLLISNNLLKTSGSSGYGIDIEKSFENNYPLRMKVIGNKLIGDNNSCPAGIDIQTKQANQQYYADGELVIENNTISGYAKGLDIMESYATVNIIGNTIKTYSSGSTAIDYATEDSNSNIFNVEISNNIITSSANTGHGISCSNNATSITTKNGILNICNNIIKGFSRGINLDDMYRLINIINNQTYDCYIYADLTYSAMENLVVANNSVYHTNAQNQQAGIELPSANSNINSATITGNNVNNYAVGLKISDIKSGYERGNNLYPTTGTRVSATNLGADFKLDV